MTHAFRWRAARVLLAPAMLAATLAWAAPEASAQNRQTTQPQPQAQPANQSKPQQQTAGRPAARPQSRAETGGTPAAQQPTPRTPAQGRTTTAQTAQAQPAAAPADEPLYREFKGVRIGTSQDEARKKLGGPEDKGKEMDFFVFSERERARVYYDAGGKASAVIVTYIGKSGDVPTPKAVLGSDIEAKPDGSMYKMVYYPKAGYWVAYSRTAGDEPLTIITMQKMAAGSQ